MIVDTQTRNRPNLELRTDWVDHQSGDGLSSRSFRTHRSPLPSLSPLAAKRLPGPLQPAAPGHDVSMQQHESAMVESLDGRGRRGSLGDLRREERSLSPIAEQAMATRVGRMAMDTPLHSKTPVVPFTAPPNTPSDPAPHDFHGDANRSMADETRSMLLSGMTASQANDLGTVANRRLSAPADMLLQKNRRQSLVLLHPDILHAWGHAYFNDPARADVLVAPSALRRHSVENGGQADGIEGSRLAIRARIRPRAKDRKPFILARCFDIDQLRTTIPTMPDTPATPSASRRQSIVPSVPEDLSTSIRTPTTPTTPLTPLTPGLNPGRRRSSVAASLALRAGGHQAKSTAKEMPVRKLGL